MAKKLAVPRRVLRKLSREQLLDLGDFIQELLRDFTAEETGGVNEVVGERSGGRETYRRVLIRCGRSNCKCAEGRGHGPYWYAYWTEAGRTRARYVGKNLPDTASFERVRVIRLI
jgi:hypothetical protein